MIPEIQIGFNNEILRQKAMTISVFNLEIKKLEKTLIKKLKAEKNGVGLAAPQIGISIRMIAGMFFNKKITVMCNPEFIAISSQTTCKEEGCLSMPGVFGKVIRYQDILVKYQNSEGKHLKTKLSNLPARIFQHELDHLDGILFVDKVNDDLLVDKEVDLKLLGLAIK